MISRHTYYFLGSLLLIIFSSLLLPLTSLKAEDTRALGCCEKTKKTDTTKKIGITMTNERCNDDTVYSAKFISDSLALNDKCVKKSEINLRKLGDPIYFTPEVSIPGTTYNQGQPVKIEDSTISIANYIIAITKYATGIIGIIAVVALMIGGVLWLTAAGNNEQISTAKKTISSSLAGMCLAFGSFLILSTLNSNLVNLKITNVTKVDRLSLSQGCCEKISKDGLTTTAMDASRNTCEAIQADKKQMENYKTVTFLPEFKAIGNECKSPMGCCKIYTKLPGDNQGGETMYTDATYEDRTEADCKQLNGSAYSTDFIAGKKVAADKKSCDEAVDVTTTSTSSCIQDWKWSCAQKSDCCSSTFICVGGYSNPTTRCDSCVGIWKWGCTTDSDCCTSEVYPGATQGNALKCAPLEEGQSQRKCVPR